MIPCECGEMPQIVSSGLRQENHSEQKILVVLLQQQPLKSDPVEWQRQRAPTGVASVKLIGSPRWRKAQRRVN